MSRYKLEVMLSEELLGRLDEARLFEPRASFARRALEAALGGEAVKQPAGQVFGVVGPSRSGMASEVRQEGGRAPAASGSRASAPTPPRAHEPDPPVEGTPLPKIAKRKW